MGSRGMTITVIEKLVLWPTSEQPTEYIGFGLPRHGVIDPPQPIYYPPAPDPRHCLLRASDGVPSVSDLLSCATLFVYSGHRRKLHHTTQART